MNETIKKVISQFVMPQGETEAAPYGNGHINDTLCVIVHTAQGRKRYILQRVNSYVFPKPTNVIENIEKVTAYLKDIIEKEGGNPERETLTLVKARDGKNYVIGEDGELWRMYLFVEETKSVDLPDTPELFALSGRAFGKFQQQLGGFDASVLHETIVDFHNTPARYAQLEDAIARNAAGRLELVSEEVAFCKKYEREVHTLLDALKAGEIPLRVTHNDTKLNNVLLDAESGEGVCVIDLDTVMPGLAAYDFGDSIRSGANTAAEDERDLSKVDISLDMFRAFAEGFLAEAGAALNQREKELLPMGAKLMTLECGMRFLADYLNGDKYFRIHRENHNLDRARTQFTLVRRMEEKWDEMMDIIAKIG
ncbi:MAG: aminoglycoside phosphotransferase family protein [Clostridia bacterium]|nr:aminoglycoside phosphotransferase family protein [Clostridia bacterium]